MKPHPSHPPHPLKADIAIMGGGITGLWALNRLNQLGYSAILLESKQLGGGQTIHSQGIIHGGLKYALQGVLSGSIESIMDMPTRWKACLKGEGEIDLSQVKTLSANQLMISTGGFSSNLTHFFAAQSLQSQVEKIKRDELPVFMQNPKFKGQAYSLQEVVLDVTSLVCALSAAVYDHIIKIDSPSLVDELPFVIESEANQTIKSLEFKSGGNWIRLEANYFLFTAGEGNQALGHFLTSAPLMQVRPLHMVVVRLKKHYPLFGHIIDTGTTPRLTITSHKTEKNEPIWYLGGKIAEEGVNRDEKSQIEFAKAELNTLFPWLDFSEADFRTFRINRAEAKQPDNKRPDSFSFECIQNAIVGWPTKLALAPAFVDKLMDFLETKQQAKTLKERRLKEEGAAPELLPGLQPTLSLIKQPECAKPIWDRIFNESR